MATETATWKQWLRYTAMRTSVRWTTASSQTKTGTTRTTSSSPSTTPMTTLTHGTPTIAWCTCIEFARTFVPQLVMIISHTLMAQVLSAFIVTHGHIHGRTSLTRFSALHFFLFFLSVPVFLFHFKLFPELHCTTDMANLRLSTAEENEDTLNVFYPPTGREEHFNCDRLSEKFNQMWTTIQDFSLAQTAGQSCFLVFDSDVRIANVRVLSFCHLVYDAQTLNTWFFFKGLKSQLFEETMPGETPLRWRWWVLRVIRLQKYI